MPLHSRNSSNVFKKSLKLKNECVEGDDFVRTEVLQEQQDQERVGLLC